MKIYRQGDVLVEEVKSLPKNLKIKKDNILVHSDSTQHDHTLKNGKVWVDKHGDLYLEVPKATQIVHTEDHKPVDISKGVYKVIRQKEYLMENMTRVVVD